MGMIFKGLTFGGVNSLDYGIFITGEAVYNAPERSVTSIEIEGRNGDLLIDNGRFLNIEIKYPAGCFAETQEDFKQKIESFRNAIISQISYQRLTDDYNPDEYRLAVYKSGLDVSVAVLHQGGEFNLTFDCKPQRFLTSGETERSIPEWSDLHTDSGSLVTVDNSSGEYAVKSLSTAIVPQQDLNGYDQPWAGGAGKNKLPVLKSTTTINTVTFTVSSDGTITANGTPTANTYFYFLGEGSDALNVPDGEYILTGCPAGGSSSTYYLQANNGSWRSDYGSGVTFTSTSQNVKSIGIAIKSGVQVNNLVFKPMLRLSSESDATWEPYTNICPITGFDSVSVTRTGKNLLNPNDSVIGIFWNGNPSPSHARLVIPCEPSTDYVLSMNGTNVLNSICLKTTGRVPAINKGDEIINAMPYSFTTGAQDIYIVIQFESSYYIHQEDIDNLKLQLEHGSTVTEYEPFGTEYTVSFGSAGTVYGGTLDVVSGQLTVTYKSFTFDGTQAVTDRISSQNRVYYQISDMATGSFYSDNNVMCNRLEKVASVSSDATAPPAIVIGYNSKYVYIQGVKNIGGANITDLASLNTWVSANNIVITYPLATPLTYQLTPTQILLMLGNNYLWGNITDISVEYGNGGFYLNNPTLFDSKPLLIVSGYGILGIGSQSITIENGYPSQVVYIDCESMEAWTESGGVKAPANDLIQNAGDAFPVLTSGMNAISLASTISEVKITPRWWRI